MKITDERKQQAQTCGVDPAMIRFINCGKAGIPQAGADLYLDCRVMWNPYRDPVLGHLTGDDPKMQEWIKTNNPTLIKAFTGIIQQGLATRGTRNSGKDPSKPFVVCTFCLAGVHRSRGMKHVLAEVFKQAGCEVEVA